MDRLLLIILLFFSGLSYILVHNISAEVIEFDTTPFAFTFNPDNEKMYYIYHTYEKTPYVAVISKYDDAKIPIPNEIILTSKNITQNEFKNEKPISIIYNPSDKNIYVLSLASSEEGGSIVFKINGTDDTIIDTIKLPEMRYPVTLAYNPSNDYIYVSGSFDPMELINTTTGISTELNKISSAFDITYNPQNKNLYLTTGAKMNTNSDSNSLLVQDENDKPILVLSGKTNKIIDSISINASTYFSEYNPSDKQIYVTSSEGIFSINSTNNRITNHIDSEILNDSKLFDIVYNSADKLMYISSDIGVISVNITNNEVDVIEDTIDESPWSIIYNPVTELIYFNHKHFPDRFCQIGSDNPSLDSPVFCLLKW